MEFNRSIVSNFEKSFNFLIKSLSDTCEFLNKQDIENRNQWLIQVERFSSVFERIKNEGSKNGQLHPLEGLKDNIIYPIFQEHSTMLTALVVEDDVIRDSFIKIPKDSSDEKPRGIKLEIGKFYLPVSEIYTDIVSVAVNNPNINVVLPIRILLGFFSTVYHTITLKEDDQTLVLVKENIDKLISYIEVNELPRRQKASTNPMDMIQKALGNIDMSKISDMFNKVSGNSEASKEFNDVLSKMSDGMKNGKPFTDVMGDLVKEASVNASMDEEEISSSEPATSQEDSHVSETATSQE